MTSRLLAVLLAPALFALPLHAQEEAPPAAPPVPAEGGDSETDQPSAAEATAPSATPASAEASGAAPAPSESVVAEAKKSEPFPLSVSAGLTTSMGQSTFVSGYNPTVASSLGITPSLKLWSFGLSASQSFDFEWTQSDSNTYPYQIVWSDTQLAASYGGLSFEELGLGFRFNTAATLPISLASRFQGKITGLSAGMQASWSYEPWGLAFFGGGGGNYNIVVRDLAGRFGEVDPYTDRTFGEVTPSLCVRRVGETGDACALRPPGGGYVLNTGGSWSTLEGALSFSASMGWMQSFSSYLGPDDEYTSPNAQTGLQGKMPMTTGSITASYTPISWFTLSVGTQSFQPVLTDDLQGVRWFPFWDFHPSALASNYSSVFVDTTFTY